MIEQLKTGYDYVLSTPRLRLLRTPYCFLTGDGVILIMVPGKTRVDHAKEAKRLLASVKARVLGVVLNGVERTREDYYYYYYYGDRK